MMTDFVSILETFESAWQDSQQSADVREFLPSPESEDYNAVVSDLFAVDLELRWKNFYAAKKGNGRSNHRDGLQLLHDLPALPVAEDYFKLSQFLKGDRTAFEQLIIGEMIARNRWGDEPSIIEYERRFGDDEELIFALEKGLDLICPLYLTVQQDNQTLLARKFDARAILGRQTRGEPAPPAWVPGKRKLVVASRELLSLSRSQATIRRIGKSLLELKNTSSNVTILLSNSRLEPNDSVLLSTPLHFQAGEFSIYVSDEVPE